MLTRPITIVTPAANTSDAQRLLCREHFSEIAEVSMRSTVWRRGTMVIRLVAGAVIIAGLAATGRAEGVLQGVSAEPLTRAANQWLESLDAPQRRQAVRPFADATRTAWHFVP